MFRFFEKTKFTGAQKRKFAFHVNTFEMAEGYDKNPGHIVKISIADTSTTSAINTIHDNVIVNNPECLFIVTSSTTRLKSTFNDDVIHPGHNFSFITDKKGKIIECMSKRPGKKMLCSSERIPDSRFKTQASVYVYDSVFTSVEDELAVWEKRAAQVEHYPLYIHIVPLQNPLNIDKHSYQQQVSKIKKSDEPYALHSRLHPIHAEYIRGNNCNSALYQSIFGKEDMFVQDMYCQEVAIKIMESFVQDKQTYKQLAYEIGLMDGIEPLNIPKENYERYSLVM